MSKILFETVDLLHPRDDKEPYEVARDIVFATANARPELLKHTWLVRVQTYDDGHAKIIVQVTDPNKLSHKEWANLFVWAGITLLIFWFLSAFD